MPTALTNLLFNPASAYLADDTNWLQADDAKAALMKSPQFKQVMSKADALRKAPTGLPLKPTPEEEKSLSHISLDPQDQEADRQRLLKQWREDNRQIMLKQRREMDKSNAENPRVPATSPSPLAEALAPEIGHSNVIYNGPNVTRADWDKAGKFLGNAYVDPDTGKLVPSYTSNQQAGAGGNIPLLTHEQLRRRMPELPSISMNAAWMTPAERFQAEQARVKAALDREQLVQQSYASQLGPISQLIAQRENLGNEPRRLVAASMLAALQRGELDPGTMAMYPQIAALASKELRAGGRDTYGQELEKLGREAQQKQQRHMLLKQTAEQAVPAPGKAVNLASLKAVASTLTPDELRTLLQSTLARGPLGGPLALRNQIAELYGQLAQMSQVGPSSLVPITRDYPSTYYTVRGKQFPTSNRIPSFSMPLPTAETVNKYQIDREAYARLLDALQGHIDTSAQMLK